MLGTFLYSARVIGARESRDIISYHCGNRVMHYFRDDTLGINRSAVLIASRLLGEFLQWARVIGVMARESEKSHHQHHHRQDQIAKAQKGMLPDFA
jgi:hypothetical protein